MKKIHIYFSLLLFVVIGIFSSCSKDSFDESLPDNPVLVPIKSVTAQDGPVISKGVISDANRTIEMEFYNLSNLEAVEVHLEISKRAHLLAPLDTIVTLDLRESHEIVIDNLFDEITYTLTASLPEYVFCDKSQFKAFNLNNDTPPLVDPMHVLWDGEDMSKPEDYGSIGYRNYATESSFTFDIGTRFDGSYYYLKHMNVSLYWAYTHTCPKRYELWGYMKPGEPPLNGDWSDWTKLADIDNSNSTLADFADGDNVEWDKDDSPSVRYLRVICRQNWRDSPPLTNISICELTFWAWNK